MEVISSTRVPAKIWTQISGVESGAIDQIKNLANMPFTHKHVAIMPDCHYGIGATVGSVVATLKAVIPASVGVDIGCGMLAVKTNLTANDLPDDLGPTRHNIERQIPVGNNAYRDYDHLKSEDHILFAGIKNTFTPTGLKLFESVRQDFMKQCGTLGGGNHFIELCLDGEDNVWIMLHSGSRGIGNKIGTHFIEIAKKEMEKHFISLPDKDLAYLVEGSAHFTEYVDAVHWAQDYALLNRRIMLRRIVDCLSYQFKQLRIENDAVIQCHHNYISREHHFGQNVIVTRKGAVRAREGDMVIIPGSMGTCSYIAVGKGNPESFMSCSHGAGRRMSRSDAKRQFTVEDHIKATEGVECRKDEGVVDETPMAYKDLDVVMENQRDLVEPVHKLRAVLCVKG
jgi:tRNA-splicing ligase RtcB